MFSTVKKMSLIYTRNDYFFIKVNKKTTVNLWLNQRWYHFKKTKIPIIITRIKVFIVQSELYFYFYITIRVVISRF